jgi:hypothetical protein
MVGLTFDLRLFRRRREIATKNAKPPIAVLTIAPVPKAVD